MHFALLLFLFITIHSPVCLAVLCASLSLEHINLWLSRLKKATTTNPHHLKGSLFQTWGHCHVKLWAACQELKQFCTASAGFRHQIQRGGMGLSWAPCPCDGPWLSWVSLHNFLQPRWDLTCTACGAVGLCPSNTVHPSAQPSLLSFVLPVQFLISIRLMQDVWRVCFCLACRCDTAWGYRSLCLSLLVPVMPCCTTFHHPQSIHSLPACRWHYPFLSCMQEWK